MFDLDYLHIVFEGNHSIFCLVDSPRHIGFGYLVGHLKFELYNDIMLHFMYVDWLVHGNNLRDLTC